MTCNYNVFIIGLVNQVLLMYISRQFLTQLKTLTLEFRRQKEQMVCFCQIMIYSYTF